MTEEILLVYTTTNNFRIENYTVKNFPHSVQAFKHLYRLRLLVYTGVA